MTTIKEIAEMAGVSMTTVYNVLHGNVKKVSKANMESVKSECSAHRMENGSWRWQEVIKNQTYP